MNQAYSVTEVNSYIKNMFVRDYVLNNMYVKGEVSNCKYHTSGHIYFTLKDSGGQLACVMFAGQRRGLTFRLEEGQSVIALGSIGVYERDGKYQLYAREILLDGAGVLYEKFEKLKQQLGKEGLFEQDHKKPIPQYPSKIGVVTASTGAAIQDILNISKRRNPYVQIILYPALVQGVGAAASITKGIKKLDAMGLDTIIVGRGGGSIEDLWAFNEEVVARAIYECKTPIISAVGHETDVTIADFVSDLRAPTPSAAAELAVPELLTQLRTIKAYEDQLLQLMKRKTNEYRNELSLLQMRLSYTNPMFKIRQKRQMLVDYEDRVQKLMKNILTRKHHQMDLYVEKMQGLSPLNQLKRGYAYVQNNEGNVVNSINKVGLEQSVLVHVMDGTITAKVESIQKVKRI